MASKGKKITAVKGMVDILPPETSEWLGVEEIARRVFTTYGYREIRTPVVERLELFRRGVGETTSIVEKEMYHFVDQGEEALALRPEGTASVVRAYIDAGVDTQNPLARYYYLGPMFRRERPQKGRQRQFHQIGCELLGVEDPFADAEVIAMAAHFLEDVGVTGLAIEINSIGCAACRPGYNDALVAFLEGRREKLCDDCRRRLERNPLRVLDCKVEDCRAIVAEAPRLPDHWCEACVEHFQAVRDGLELLGVPFVHNERIVRGLDYYVRTAFEITTTALGAQNAVAAGGRFDGLVAALGGPEVAGIGFALGVERLLLLLREQGMDGRKEDLVFFALMGEQARRAMLPIIQTIRRDGVRAEWDFAGRSLKAQMRMANRIGAESVVIVGDEEIAKGEAVVRDMRAQTQHAVRLRDLPLHFVQIGG